MINYDPEDSIKSKLCWKCPRLLVVLTHFEMCILWLDWDGECCWYWNRVTCRIITLFQFSWLLQNCTKVIICSVDYLKGLKGPTAIGSKPIW